MGDLAQEVADQEAERSRAQADDLKRQLAATRRTIVGIESENEALRKVADVARRPLKPPRWLTPKRSKSDDHQAIVATILSDTHFDEVVNLDETGGLNTYDRAIAEQRLERYFSGLVKVTRDYLAGMTYEGCVLMLGGDLISGDIHEELKETNEGTTLETVLYWTERIAAGITMLADEFGTLHVPCVVGNHGRRTRKPRSKKRARDNFDWLLCQMLAGHFKDDERVTFDIPDSTDVLVRVYDTTFLLTHGDQTGGGGGIGGIWPGVMRMIAKKRTRYTFDSLVMGHFHQLIMAPTAGVIVNGSLKGFDEFSATMNFKPERSQQALWTVAPNEGVTFAAPVFCDDSKQEGWG